MKTQSHLLSKVEYWGGGEVLLPKELLSIDQYAFEAVKGDLIFQPSFSEFSFAVTIKVEHSVDLLM